MIVISALDYNTGVLDRTELVSSLSSNWQVGNSTPYTCTSPSGNVFTVTESGIILEGESNTTPETHGIYYKVAYVFDASNGNTYYLVEDV